MALDFKKQRKDLYQPKAAPSIVDVPEMTFIAIDGKGDPNTSAEYAKAIELIYGLSYTIKMGNKSILEYVVSPLEGFWRVDDEGFKGGGTSIADKGKFLWTMLIRQPDFVNAEIFEAAKAAFAKKKPGFDVSVARLEVFAEGLCVQALHVGSYDNEPATVAALERHAAENGYAVDIGLVPKLHKFRNNSLHDTRQHHEIYLSDPRKVAVDKLKTVVRHPIRKMA